MVKSRECFWKITEHCWEKLKKTNLNSDSKLLRYSFFQIYLRTLNAIPIKITDFKKNWETDYKIYTEMQITENSKS